MNILVTGIFFYFLVKLGLNINYSFLYALSLAILAYPSIGTPFVDHHAAYFSIIAVSYFILSLKVNNKKFLFLSSIFLVLSFFSKQIPAAYLGIFLLIILMVRLFINKKDNFLYYIYGTFFAFFFCYSIFSK